MNELKFNIKLNRLLPLSYEGDKGYQRVIFEGFDKLSETSTVYLYMDKHDPIPLVGLEFDVGETVTASYGQFECQLREMDGENLVHSSNQFKAIVKRWIGEPSQVVNPRVEVTLWYQELLKKIDAGVSDEKIGEEVRKYLEEHPVVSEETDPVYSADKPFIATKKELSSLFEDLTNLGKEVDKKANASDIQTVPTDEISANTSARHSHDNKTLLDSITEDRMENWDKGGEGGEGYARVTKEEHVVPSYKNKIDDFGYTDGVKLTSNGDEASDSGIFSTGFIPCIKGDVIRFKMQSGAIDTVNSMIAFYGENKAPSNAIGKSLASIIGQSAYGSPVYEDGVFTLDTNLIGYYFWNNFAYFRISSTGTGSSAIVTLNQLIEGETTEAIYPLEETVKVRRKNIDFTIPQSLSDRRIVCFGDSILALNHGDNGVLGVASRETGGTFLNCAFGGCRMASHPQAEYDAFSFYNLANAVKTNTWTAQDNALSSSVPDYYAEHLERLKSVNWDEVDEIIIAYGTNDFGGNNTIASIKGALQNGINDLATTYPNIKITIASPIFRMFGEVGSDDYVNGQGNKLTDVCDVLREVADLWHVGFVDLYNRCGINVKNASTMLSDGTHPSEEGCKVIGRVYAGATIAQNHDGLSNINPSKLVKSAFSEPQTDWTEDEKANAKSTIGISDGDWESIMNVVMTESAITVDVPMKLSDYTKVIITYTTKFDSSEPRLSKTALLWNNGKQIFFRKNDEYINSDEMTVTYMIDVINDVVCVNAFPNGSPYTQETNEIRSYGKTFSKDVFENVDKTIIVDWSFNIASGTHIKVYGIRANTGQSPSSFKYTDSYINSLIDNKLNGLDGSEVLF